MESEVHKLSYICSGENALSTELIHSFFLKLFPAHIYTEA